MLFTIVRYETGLLSKGNWSDNDTWNLKLTKNSIPKRFRPSKSNCLSFYDSQWTSWTTEGSCNIWQNYTRQCLNVKSKKQVSDYVCSSAPPNGSSNVTEQSYLYSYKREYCHSSIYVVFPELGFNFAKSGWVSDEKKVTVILVTLWW